MPGVSLNYSVHKLGVCWRKSLCFDLGLSNRVKDSALDVLRERVQKLSIWRSNWGARRWDAESSIGIWDITLRIETLLKKNCEQPHLHLLIARGSTINGPIQRLESNFLTQWNTSTANKSVCVLDNYSVHGLFTLQKARQTFLTYLGAPMRASLAQSCRNYPWVRDARVSRSNSGPDFLTPCRHHKSIKSCSWRFEARTHFGRDK